MWADIIFIVFMVGLGEVPQLKVDQAFEEREATTAECTHLAVSLPHDPRPSMLKKNSPQVKLTHSWLASSPCLAFSSCFWSSEPSELPASSARPGLRLLPSKRTSILCTELTTKLKLLKRMTKGFLTLKPMTIWESRNFLITWACLLYWLYCISQFYSFLVYLCKSP